MEKLSCSQKGVRVRLDSSDGCSCCQNSHEEISSSQKSSINKAKLNSQHDSKKITKRENSYDNYNNISLPKIRKVVHKVMTKNYGDKFYQKIDLIKKILKKLNVEANRSEIMKIRNHVNRWISSEKDAAISKKDKDSKKGIIDLKKGILDSRKEIFDSENILDAEQAPKNRIDNDQNLKTSLEDEIIEIWNKKVVDKPILKESKPSVVDKPILKESKPSVDKPILKESKPSVEIIVDETTLLDGEKSSRIIQNCTEKKDEKIHIKTEKIIPLIDLTYEDVKIKKEDNIDSSGQSSENITVPSTTYQPIYYPIYCWYNYPPQNYPQYSYYGSNNYQSSNYDYYQTEISQPYPSQHYPSQPYPMQPYPSQPYPSQPYPLQSYPSHPNPSQPYPSQPNPSHPYPSQPNPSQPNPSQPNPSQPNPSQPNPSQPNPSQPNPSQPNSSQPNQSQPNPPQPYLSQPNSSQPNPSQPNPPQPYLSQPNPSQPSQPYSSQPYSSQPTENFSQASYNYF